MKKLPPSYKRKINFLDIMSDSEENKDDDQKKMGFLSRNAKRAMYSPTAQRHRATEDALLGDLESAIEQYDEYLELWPRDAEVIAIKAHVTSILGEDEEALDIYNESLESEPKRAWTWFEKAVLLEDMERYSEAVLCYQRALEHTKEGFRNEIKNRPDPPKEDILGPLSHAYFHAGSKDDLRLAEKYAKEAFEIEPEQYEALQTKAHLLIKHEKWEQALDVCKIILDDDDEDPHFLHVQADSHLALKNATEAYDSISRLLFVDKENADNWVLLARYYAMIGKNEKAIDKLTVAVHLDPELQEGTTVEKEFSELAKTQEYVRLINLDTIDP